MKTYLGPSKNLPINFLMYKADHFHLTQSYYEDTVDRLPLSIPLKYIAML